MTTGRNDRCPCGSGRKYKKCCLNKQSQPQPRLPEISPIKLNDRIAYQGVVGRERKEWCKKFIDWKIDQLQKITAGQQHAEEGSGRCISCSKGCSHCCSQHVAATVQESEAIVYWLHDRPDVRQSFMKRYSTWRARVKSHEAVFQDTNATASKSMSNPRDFSALEAFFKKSGEYLKLDIPCPFLDNGSCSIYPVRPFVCASHIVVSPPDDCKAGSMKEPLLLLGAPSPDIQPHYFRGGGNDQLFSPVAMLVHEIIKGGYFYLNDLPGMNGLEKEVFEDPDIRKLL